MAVPSPLPTDKSALRLELRQARKAAVGAMSAEERDHAAEQLALALEPLVERARVVAGYHAIGSEISVDAALRTAAGLGKPIALPSFDAHASPMIFRAAPVVARSWCEAWRSRSSAAAVSRSADPFARPGVDPAARDRRIRSPHRSGRRPL